MNTDASSSTGNMAKPMTWARPRHRLRIVASSHRRIVVGIDDSRDSTRAIGPCLHNYGRRGSGQASVVLDS